MKILIGGMYPTGPGYPNARNTINILRNRLQFEVIDCATPMLEETKLWRLAKGSFLLQIASAMRMLCTNFLSVCRVQVSGVKQAFVYVPYPSIIFMFLLSFFPRRTRPRCVIDAYVPLWDALVTDRQILSPTSFFARALFKIEQRSLRAAYCVVVDTIANKNLLCKAYGLQIDSVRAFPLAIDEPELAPGNSLASLRPKGIVRVLFIGTFIPLHGTQAIAQAILNLRNSKVISFRIVGDGQEATEFARLLSTNGVEIDWHRQWMSSEEICQEVDSADICLGIFGGSAKASRVFPLKLYLYAAAGKPVITQWQMSLPEGLPEPPVEHVDPSNAEALSDMLSALAASPERRFALGRDIKKYYETYLSHHALAEKWRALVDTVEASDNL